MKLHARLAPRTSALRTIALASALLASSLPVLAADGLQLNPISTAPSWQARFQLSSLDPNTPAGMETRHLPGSRLLSANLLGDYYLTSSGIGGVRGGLRATGGMLLGPLSQSQTSAGMSLGSGSLGQSLSVGQRSISLLSPNRDLNDPNASLSYMGIGYTGQTERSGFSFSADLGLINNTSMGVLRMGPVNTPALDDVLRDVRYRPLLQLGLSYSY